MTSILHQELQINLHLNWFPLHSLMPDMDFKQMLRITVRYYVEAQTRHKCCDITDRIEHETNNFIGRYALP